MALHDIFAPYLNFAVFGNTGEQIFNAALTFIVSIAVLYIFRTVVLLRLRALAKRTKTKIDDILIRSIRSIHWPFYVIISAYFAVRLLTLTPTFERYFGWFILIAATYYAVRAIQAFVDYFSEKIVEQRIKEEKQLETPVIYLLGQIIKISLWVVAILFLLSNFGVNITSLIAGLGIGGIAVALALQNILGDMFSSFTIYFDKPFRVGDFIIIGEFMGTVQHIGIKSTRIRSLGGEEIVMSNRELTATTIKNYKRMERRRIVFAFGVVYQTSSKKMEKIPQIVKAIIEKVENATPDRVHFKSFGASSLDFEVVYYMEVPDYNMYMNAQQQINLEIMRAFEKEKIEFAYPTQTLYVSKVK